MTSDSLDNEPASSESAGIELEAWFEGGSMECPVKDELEQHLSDIRRLATRIDRKSEDEQKVAIRAERFAIALLKEHNASGHDGKRCPFATQLY